jgi:hypothetical protein
MIKESGEGQGGTPSPGFALARWLVLAYNQYAER